MGFFNGVFIRNFMFDVQGITSGKFLGSIFRISPAEVKHHVNARVLQGFLQVLGGLPPKLVGSA
jgi:hypothetical protein